MKTTMMVLASVATLGLTAVAAPQQAQARGGGIAAGIFGGLVAGALIGGALAAPPLTTDRLPPTATMVGRSRTPVTAATCSRSAIGTDSCGGFVGCKSVIRLREVRFGRQDKS